MAYPTCTGGSSESGLPTIGQGQGPSLGGSVTNLPGAPNTAAQGPTCSAQLPDVQASVGPNYACSCPYGGSSQTAPSCSLTCGAQLPATQAAAGPNYLCSCPYGATSATAPSCQETCGGLLATNPSYQSNSSQACSCPSGAGSLTTPSCAPLGNIMWTTAFAGMGGISDYPGTYWVYANISGSGEILLYDGSGEGWGAPPSQYPSSCNATVESCIWGGGVCWYYLPLYASQADYNNCAKPTGMEAFVWQPDGTDCFGQGGCVTYTRGCGFSIHGAGPPYIYGWGMNPNLAAICPSGFY